MITLDLYKEILGNILSKQEIRVTFPGMEIDAAKLVETESYKALQKIKAIIEDDSHSDFDCIEAIVCLFEELGSDGGARLDFG